MWWKLLFSNRRICINVVLNVSGVKKTIIFFIILFLIFNLEKINIKDIDSNIIVGER